MNKIAVFCVGTGGHVLPAKNIIMQLNEEGIKLENFIVITDKRGSQYLKELNIKIYIQLMQQFFLAFQKIQMLKLHQNSLESLQHN